MTKFQDPNKHQTSNSKHQTLFKFFTSRRFGYWNLELGAYLVFGAWVLVIPSVNAELSHYESADGLIVSKVRSFTYQKGYTPANFPPGEICPAVDQRFDGVIELSNGKHIKWLNAPGGTTLYDFSNSESPRSLGGPLEVVQYLKQTSPILAYNPVTQTVILATVEPSRTVGMIFILAETSSEDTWIFQAEESEEPSITPQLITLIQRIGQSELPSATTCATCSAKPAQVAKNLTQDTLSSTVSSGSKDSVTTKHRSHYERSSKKRRSSQNAPSLDEVASCVLRNQAISTEPDFVAGNVDFVKDNLLTLAGGGTYDLTRLRGVELLPLLENTSGAPQSLQLPYPTLEVLKAMPQGTWVLLAGIKGTRPTRLILVCAVEEIPLSH